MVGGDVGLTNKYAHIYFDDLVCDKGGAIIFKVGNNLASGASKTTCDPHLKHICGVHENE